MALKSIPEAIKFFSELTTFLWDVQNEIELLRRQRDEAHATLDILGVPRGYPQAGVVLTVTGRIEALREKTVNRIVGMREALRPLAALAEHYPDTKDRGPASVQVGHKTIMLTGADCHWARRLLEEEAGREP